MADYSQLAYTPLFDPFSYEEISSPGLLLELRHRELEDAYAAMTDLEVLDMMLGNEGVYYDEEGNKHSKSEATQELVNNYRKELQRLVNLLSTYGVLGTSRQAMLNLKRQYEGKIKPIKELFDKREEEIKKQRDFKMLHPDAVFDNDVSQWSIDDMMSNPRDWYNYNTVQLSEVTKQAAELTSSLTESQMSAWVESTGNRDLITEYQRTGVLTQKQLAQMIASGNIPASIRPVIQPIIDQYQNAGNWDERAALQISSALSQGFVQGLSGKMSAKVTTNPSSQLDISRANLALETRKYDDALYAAAGYSYNPETKKWEKPDPTTTAGAKVYNPNDFEYDANSKSYVDKDGKHYKKEKYNGLDYMMPILSSSTSTSGSVGFDQDYGLYYKEDPNTGERKYYHDAKATVPVENPLKKPLSAELLKIQNKQNTFNNNYGGIIGFDQKDSEVNSERYTRGIIKDIINDNGTFVADVNVYSGTDYSNIKDDEDKNFIAKVIENSGYSADDFVIVEHINSIADNDFLIIEKSSLKKEGGKYKAQLEKLKEALIAEGITGID